MNNGTYYSGLTFILLIAAFLVIMFISGMRDKKKKTELFRSKLKSNFGRLPEIFEKTADLPSGNSLSSDDIRRISGYYRFHKNAHCIDDISWNDLDLERLYERINYTQSSPGEQYLYWQLRNPALSFSSAKLPDCAISSMATNEELRCNYQCELHELGKSGKYSVYDSLSEARNYKSKGNIANYLAIAFFILSIVVLFVQTQIGVPLLITAIAVNTITYYREKAGIDPYLSTFRYLLRILRCADRISALSGRSDNDPFTSEIDELESLVKCFSGFRRGSSILMTTSGTGSNPINMIFDYIRIMLHLDLIKFNSMMKEVADNYDKVDRIIGITGYIDAVISSACFRASMPEFCIPELREGNDTAITASDIYHVLIKNGKAVPNSISTNGRVLLTGSNASGKSTFLKSAAICALLSQTISTAPASKYIAPFFRIYSSMALRDDLVGGESYFIVEIRSLKRILDASDDHSTNAPILCFIDEVLRGTNTVERISASSEILMDFAGRGIACFAATHDIELCSLLETEYDNYHFTESIVDSDIQFSYKLLAGRADSRNAIKLLGAIGYDKSIIANAEERAGRFLSTGEWS